MRLHLHYALMLAALSVAGAAAAQELEPRRRPGDERLPLPQPGAPEEPQFELPPAPAAPPETDRLDPAQERFVVKDFVVEGVTVFSPEQITELTARYENRPITFEELLSLRDSITYSYINAGYPNSGALIPEQRMEDGVLRIQVVEGTLTRIDVAKTRWFRDSYFRSRLEQAATDPLNVNPIQQQLQRFQQDPRIRTVHAALHPGERPGDAVLEARFEEEVPYRVHLEANNYQSPSIGSEQIRFGLGHDNLLGFGDRLSAEAGFTEGYDDYFGSYEIPVNRWDTALGAFYEWSRSDVVEEPFDELDIESRSQTAGLRVSQPLLRDLNTTLGVSLSFEKRESQTFLLGDGFAFAPGPNQDGESRVSVARTALDYVYRDLHQVIAARSQLSVGLDLLDATKHRDPIPDGQFLDWLFQLQWVRRFERLWGLEVLLRGDGQLTTRPLLSLEQFSVGGHASVRGYRENQLVRDNALVGSLELRLPIWQTPAGSVVQLAAFGDIGQGWNRSRTQIGCQDPTSEGDPAECAPIGPSNEGLRQTLSSLGLGLRWTLTRHLEGQIYWAEALRDVPDPDDHDLQDSGIQFRIVASY